ncbi:MAG: hypothetical protein KAQ98_14650 [Bacteriovoracaceae bacterium]|nr:hypothetical protein [Bacteriovoracaceae bacterium]
MSNFNERVSMINKKLLQTINTVARKAKNLMQDGGHIYIDKKLNFNITKKAPRQSDVFLKAICIQGKKEKQKLKLKNVQKQMSAFGVALKSDIERLEKKIDSKPKRSIATKRKTSKK